MRIPVILMAPPLQAFRDTLMLKNEGASAEVLKNVLSQAVMPERFEIDSAYAPVPVPQRALEGGFADPLNPEAFLVRGTVDSESVGDVPHEIDNSRVFSDAVVDVCVVCFDGPPVGTRADVETSLDVSTLHAHGLDGEGDAIAIVDTGINLDFLEEKLGFRPRLDESLSWTPEGGSVLPGHFPKGHGTMCAYAALLAAPRATLIDIPALVGTPTGGAPIGRRVSEIYTALAPLISAWAIAFTPSGERPYKALVLSNSWAMYNPGMDFPQGHPGRYADNPHHFFTSTLSAASTDAQMDIVFAAGNCGPDCPLPNCEGAVAQSITGANASASVLTIAGCDTLGRWVGYSSTGPGIAGMAQDKPDFACYTHFKGSEALGAGMPDKGTSTSCPVAAGCIAAVRTAMPSSALSPLELYSVLRETARPAGDTFLRLGHGILDPVAAARVLGLISDVS